MCYIALAIWDAIHTTKGEGQAVADFLADHPAQGTSKLYNDLPNEIAEVNIINTSSEEQVRQLFFDGASRTNPEGNIITSVGVVIISPHNYVIPHAFSLIEPCSNNVSKYNAFLIRMKLAEDIRVKNLEAYGDSKAHHQPGSREHKDWHEYLVPYHIVTIIMLEKFENFYIDHVPHQQNAHVDVLASLAASLALPTGATERVLVYSRNLYCYKFALENSRTPRRNLQIKEDLQTLTSLEYRDWKFSYIDFILYGIFPDDPKEAAAIRRKAPRFYYNAIMQTLYRRSYDGIYSMPFT